MDPELAGGFAFDHVLIAVSDLDRAAENFRARHGLESVAGGRHSGFGTGNRIIPLGRDYIELIAVVDEDEAATSPLAQWVDGFQGSAALGGLCLRTNDIDGVAANVKTQVLPMQRALPGGGVIKWKLAGLEATLADPSLPFFIQWEGDGSDHPGRAVVDHPAGQPTLEWVEVSTSRERLAERLGNHRLDIRSAEGPPGILAVGLQTVNGPVVIRD